MTRTCGYRTQDPRIIPSTVQFVTINIFQIKNVKLKFVNNKNELSKSNLSNSETNVNRLPTKAKHIVCYIANYLYS